MSQQETPENDTAMASRARLDDSEGHMLIADEQPSYALRSDEQPGVKTKQHDEDDTEGHVTRQDRAAAYRVQDDEDDTAGPGAASRS